MSQNLAGAMLNVNHAFISPQFLGPHELTTPNSNSRKPNVFIAGLGISGLPKTDDTVRRDHLSLAVGAAEQAMDQARLDRRHITHIICSSCAEGWEAVFGRIVEELRLGSHVETIKLDRVGSTGELEALRRCADIALNHAMEFKPARVLCIVSATNTEPEERSTKWTDEHREEEMTDCRSSSNISAVLVSNAIGHTMIPMYELVGWKNWVLPRIEEDPKLETGRTGRRPQLSSQTRELISAALLPAFKVLVASAHQLPARHRRPADFNWIIHPFEPDLISAAQVSLGITAEHIRGSSSIFETLAKLRTAKMTLPSSGGDETGYFTACAIGPGTNLEMCIFGRHRVTSRAGVGALDQSSRSTSDSSHSSQSFGDGGLERVAGVTSPGARRHVADALKCLDLEHSS